MTKRIKRDDYLYREALSWMSYRYAIGITEFIGQNGQSDVERYKMFRNRIRYRRFLRNSERLYRLSQTQKDYRHSPTTG